MSKWLFTAIFVSQLLNGIVAMSYDEWSRGLRFFCVFVAGATMPPALFAWGDWLVDRAVGKTEYKP